MNERKVESTMKVLVPGVLHELQYSPGEAAALEKLAKPSLVYVEPVHRQSFGFR